MPLPLLNTNLGQQDLSTSLAESRLQSQGVADATPSVKFGEQLMSMLRQYQTMGTSGLQPFREKTFNAQEAQARRVFSGPGNLAGASPTQQASVRSADVSAIEPTVTGSQQATGAFIDRLNSFNDVVGRVQSIGEWMQKQEEEQKVREEEKAKEAREMIFSQIEAVKGLPEAQRRELEKAAGLQKGMIDLIPSPKKAFTYQDLGNRVAQIDDQGNIVGYLPKGATPTSGGGQSDQLYSGLSPQTATAIKARVSKFASEPLVQGFATVQDGYNFASAIPDATTNPADDQALIYALAKALDPGSVVREGEYATAQKYSQSWVNQFGKGVEQAILGTGFLSETARRNIKQTIKQKYEASKKSYDNIYTQYTTGINALSGRQDGAQFLTDYAISNTGGGVQGASTSDIDHTIQQHQGDYQTREQLIDAIVATGQDRNTVSSRVYTLIPDKK